jgi:anaerobic magnesium-protoporphyrin IX monomethyl ester cyclase
MKVLLIHPGKKEHKPKAPFGLLVLAGYLREYGVGVEVVDTRVQDLESSKSFRAIREKDHGYTAVGIHAKTGEQIRHAIDVARRIREERPSLPIIWGGPHPTFYPEQTSESDLADYVVKGDGEEVMLDLLRKIDNREDLKPVQEAKCVGMDSLPLPAYDLVNMDDYMDPESLFQYETSRGCPGRCAFCYVSKAHTRWRAKPNEKIIADLVEIKRRYGPKSLFFTDDNFFVNKDKALELCQLMIKHSICDEWWAEIRADYVTRYSDKELQLLKRSGARYFQIGAESGSQKILDYLDKGITPRHVFGAAAKLTKNGIIPVFSFIIGTPEETGEDLQKTLDMYKELLGSHQGIQINGLFLYTPYPGNKLYDEAKKHGYKEKESLEGWAEWRFNSVDNIPWLKDFHRLKTLHAISFHCSIHKRAKTYGKRYVKQRLGKLSTLFYPISQLMWWDAKARLATDIYRFAPEWKLFSYVTQKKLGMN